MLCRCAPCLLEASGRGQATLLPQSARSGRQQAIPRAAAIKLQHDPGSLLAGWRKNGARLASFSI
eukprot:4451421-Pyramimonas_sp.AAC.1